MFYFYLILIIRIGLQHEWLYLPVESYFNIAFMLEAEIKNTPLYFIIDTGSSVTMLESYYKQSETFTSLNQTYEQDYDFGKCMGIFGNDKVVLAKQVQISQFKMVYGKCSKMPFFDERVGLMGMSNKNQVKHIFEDNQFQSSIFGLQLRKDSNSKLYYNISSFDYPIIWHSLNENQRWMITLLGVFVDQQDVSDIFTGKAFMDSGYSCLILSESQFAFVWNNYFIKFCKIIDNQIYCDCQNQSYPKFTLYFEGSKIIINSTNYFPYSYNGQLCKLCISKHSRNYIILGLPFFMSTTILFDKVNQQIGIIDSQRLQQIPELFFQFQFILIIFMLCYILFYTIQKDKKYIKIELEMTHFSQRI